MSIQTIGTPFGVVKRIVALFEKYGIDDAMQITQGRYFWPMRDDPGDIDLNYIAHSLALMCRWNGGTTDLKTGAPLLFTVGQHSVMVSYIVERLLSKAAAFYGLMHDASEAYLTDVPRPIKGSLGGYYEAEAILMAKIITHFNVPMSPEIKAAVRTIDNNMIFWERDELIGQPCLPYANENEHPGGTIHDVWREFRVWSPVETKERFIARFHELQLETA